VLPVPAVVAQLPLLVQALALVPVVVVQLWLLLQPQVKVQLPKDVVVRARRPLLVQPALLAQAPREAVAVRVDVAVHLLTRSFSAAMAGLLPPPVPPT